jgi:hypothetical protein
MSFHASWYKSYAAEKTSGTRFDVIRPRSGMGHVTLAEVSTSALASSY